MKTEKKIFVAFVLNLLFSAFEFCGGILTGSAAIASDAIHDLGDAVGIGASWLLERKSKKEPDAKCTYGYGRYSVLGGVLVALVLMAGSAVAICNGIDRLIHPVKIHYSGMIVFAAVGFCVNLAAAYFTQGGESINQRVVNLHMLEDTLGWAVVLIGALVINFTDWRIIDPLLSIGVAMFIMFHAVRELKKVADIFLEKAPKEIDVNALQKQIAETEGVSEVHHLHVWSLDGITHCATIHLVTSGDMASVKNTIRELLHKNGIPHCVLETEREDGHCPVPHCHIHYSAHSHCHHH